MGGHASVGCRGPAHNSNDDNQTLLEIEFVDDPIVPYAATPAGRLSLEPLDIALEGILFHRKKGILNARLIFSRKPSEVFLSGPGELQVPSHGGIGSMIQHRPAEEQRDRGGARQVPPLSRRRQDTDLRNKRAGLRGQVQNAYAIPPSEPAQIAAPSRAARKPSLSVLFS
jgi:hypothetical protein